MNGWQRWLQAPATHRLHRVLFQLHLWLGIACGLYILLISVSGSAVVLRPQISRWFVNSQVQQVSEAPLSGEQLQQILAQVYDGYKVLDASQSRRPGSALYVRLERDGAEHSRYFDQYLGQDLGPTFPWQARTVEWLTRLHDELLLGHAGRQINGIGGILFLLMVLSGLLLWWQGTARWQQALVIRRSGPRGLLWQLHSFAGFWSMLLLLVWGITAVYFAWPEPFEAIVDGLDDNLEDFERPDSWIRTLVGLHFGRFREHLWLSVVWMLLGLVPALMFISGFLLWYRRVVKKLIRQPQS